MYLSLWLTEPITAPRCFFSLDVKLILQVLDKMDAAFTFLTRSQDLEARGQYPNFGSRSGKMFHKTFNSQ